MISSHRAVLDYPTIVAQETARMVEAVQQGPLDARVPGCPEWNLAQLADHMGAIQRWATGIVLSGEPGPLATNDGVDPALFLAEGAGPLVAALRAADPTAVCWNFTEAPKTAAFWGRRQALEVAAHRWDAQSAVGSPEPIDGELAADAIDEWATLMLARIVRRKKLDLTAFVGDLHLHCTDVSGEWNFEIIDGAVVVTTDHRKSAAAVRGPASDLYLYLMNRVGDDRVERFGDIALVDRWRDVLTF